MQCHMRDDIGVAMIIVINVLPSDPLLQIVELAALQHFIMEEDKIVATELLLSTCIAALLNKSIQEAPKQGSKNASNWLSAFWFSHKQRIRHRRLRYKVRVGQESYGDVQEL